MGKQKKLDRLYMNMAIEMSTISYGIRAKVGAILVTKNGVVLTGVNGLPSALGNELEEQTYELISQFGQSPILKPTGLVTRSEVIHAELNCILKAAREGVSTIDSTIYVTVSPCAQCASMLASVGVKRVVFLDEYRNIGAIATLGACGVIVEKLEDIDYEV